MSTNGSALSAQRNDKYYLERQLEGMTPVELLLKLYDVAIVSCVQQDSDRLSRALVELIAALNFEQREAAAGLLRLYNYCLHQAKARRFDLVRPILCELRDSWSAIMRSSGQAAAEAVRAESA